MKATKRGWKMGNMYITSRLYAEAVLETREIEKSIGLTK